MKEAFRKFSKLISNWSGSPAAFVLASLTIVAWALTGPMFGYSDTWQLVINTGTTIVTFLMVFLIQNTQNRDGRIVQLKLDELIRANKLARNKLIDLEDLNDDELDVVQDEFHGLQKIAESKIDEIKRVKKKREKKPKK